MSKWSLALRRVIRKFFAHRDRASEIMEIPYGCCARCRESWKTATPHDTPYSESCGMFPLCRSCWRELTWPELRLPYYIGLVEAWRRDGLSDEDAEVYKAGVTASVMEGK